MRAPLAPTLDLGLSTSNLKPETLNSAPNPSSGAPNRSTALPNRSSRRPNPSSRAQVERFANRCIRTNLSRQTPYKFAPAKTASDLSAPIAARVAARAARAWPAATAALLYSTYAAKTLQTHGGEGNSASIASGSLPATVESELMALLASDAAMQSKRRQS